jgi:hypothetical protein
VRKWDYDLDGLIKSLESEAASTQGFFGPNGRGQQRVRDVLAKLDHYATRLQALNR